MNLSSIVTNTLAQRASWDIEEILSKSPAGPDNIFGDPDYPIAYNPTYKKNQGPIKVTVVDPLNVVSSKFHLWMDSLKIVKLKNVVGDPIIKGDTASKLVAKWHLKDLGHNVLLLNNPPYG